MAMRSFQLLLRFAFLPAVLTALACSDGSSVGTTEPRAASPQQAPAAAPPQGEAAPPAAAVPSPPASSAGAPAASAAKALAYTASYQITPADLVTYVTAINRVFNFNKLGEKGRRQVVEEIFVNHQLALEAMNAGLQHRPALLSAVNARIAETMTKFIVEQYNARLDELAAVTDEEVYREIDEKLGEGVVLWTIALADKARLEALRAEIAAAPADKRTEVFTAKAREHSEGLTADKGGALGLVSTKDSKIPGEYVKEFLELPAGTLSGVKPIHKSHYLFLVGDKVTRADRLRDHGPGIRAKLFPEKRQKLLADKLAELEKSLKVKIYWERFEKDYQRPDKDVVASVNGQDIRLNTQANPHGANVFTPKQQINRYVTHLVLAEEARRLGLDKTPEYKRAEALAVDREWRTAFLQTRGEGREPTEAQIRKYFDESTRSDLLEVAVVKVPTLEKAKKVRALVGKKSFEELVAEYSQDPEAKKKKGLWGRFQKGALVPELDGPLFRLKAGEVSQPLPLEGGYGVFKVLTRSPSPYTELTPDVRQVIVNRLKLGQKSSGIESAAQEAGAALAGLTVDKAALLSIRLPE